MASIPSYIDTKVYLTNVKYYDLLRKTKEKFFQFLNEGRSADEFEIEASKIWEGIDHNWMQQAIRELDTLVDDKNASNNNQEETFKDLYTQKKKATEIKKNSTLGKSLAIAGASVFINTEKKYKNDIVKYYAGKKETIDNGYVDKKEYLAKVVSKYDAQQQTIPYYNARGDITSYHTVADYNSMIFNTNLVNSGWQRTIQDSRLSGDKLYYVPPHTGACEHCRLYQGKVFYISSPNEQYNRLPYSKKGGKLNQAIRNGLKHPNCKHTLLIYYDDSQFQENDYSGSQWQEYYDNTQKIRAIDRKLADLKNDNNILDSLDAGEQIDANKAKMSALRKAKRELISSNKSFKADNT